MFYSVLFHFTCNLLYYFYFSCDKKFECFTVSCAPVLSEIELHNRRFWDVLTVSLQSSILRDVALVESFISESRLLLEKQPQSLLEIGDANASYVKIMNSSKEVRILFCPLIILFILVILE